MPWSVLYSVGQVPAWDVVPRKVSFTLFLLVRKIPASSVQYVHSVKGRSAPQLGQPNRVTRDCRDPLGRSVGITARLHELLEMRPGAFPY
ncbi:hypothetical protein GCM10023108_28300 [Saccharopolyspora hordei]